MERKKCEEQKFGNICVTVLYPKTHTALMSTSSGVPLRKVTTHTCKSNCSSVKEWKKLLNVILDDSAKPITLSDVQGQHFFLNHSYGVVQVRQLKHLIKIRERPSLWLKNASINCRSETRHKLPVKDFSPCYTKDTPHPELALYVGTGCKLCAAEASNMNVISREPGMNC